jgi:chorismate synthase
VIQRAGKEAGLGARILTDVDQLLNASLDGVPAIWATDLGDGFWHSTSQSSG